MPRGSAFADRREPRPQAMPRGRPRPGASARRPRLRSWRRCCGQDRARGAGVESPRDLLFARRREPRRQALPPAPTSSRIHSTAAAPVLRKTGVAARIVPRRAGVGAGGSACPGRRGPRRAIPRGAHVLAHPLSGRGSCPSDEFRGQDRAAGSALDDRGSRRPVHGGDAHVPAHPLGKPDPLFGADVSVARPASKRRYPGVRGFSPRRPAGIRAASGSARRPRAGASARPPRRSGPPAARR